jgi:hypothetical protein
VRIAVAPGVAIGPEDLQEVLIELPAGPGGEAALAREMTNPFNVNLTVGALSSAGVNTSRK